LIFKCSPNDINVTQVEMGVYYSRFTKKNSSL